MEVIHYCEMSFQFYVQNVCGKFPGAWVSAAGCEALALCCLVLSALLADRLLEGDYVALGLDFLSPNGVCRSFPSVTGCIMRRLVKSEG